ncbi:MAG TPA: phenylalanine--tRNA ligase subunit beta, partial [Candidatus Krumholzibacterium sp.]|nr:phenylalanine--tRNA ligase subunit beta [Candidatus Krumholzibacterium sp.]
KAGGSYRIEIDDPVDCPRFSAAFVDNVKVGPSPDWLRELLVSAGLKPINNIVDITNFVLMETGQPLHAYDRDTLGGDMIRVRRAGDLETVRTLDDVERKLNGNVLVIADADRPVGVAGVMGGGDTEVTSDTVRILLESAAFGRKAVRASSHFLKLDTDASYRFERESDPGATVRALERACWLIRECGAGDPSGIVEDVIACPDETVEKEIFLRVSQANRVMGTHLAADDLSELLERLHLPCRIEENGVRVSVPTFRRDIKEEIDLIEETARVYGYENIGRDEEVRGNIFSKVSVSDMRREGIRNYLAARGFAEAITSSFMDREDIRMMDWAESDQRSNPLPLSNPLSAQQSMMRSSLLPGLLRVIARNTPSEQECIRIFELGKVFLQVDGKDSLPEEQTHLTALFTRGNVPSQWLDPGRDTDYFVMKGELEELFARFPAGEMPQIARSREDKNSFIFDWLLKDRVLATSGMLPGRVSRAYDVDTPVFFFSIRLDELDSAGFAGVTYEKPSPYPQVKRDLCVVALERVTFADIRKVVEKRAKYLESIRLFDYYRGDKVGEGKRSYAFRIGFRSPEGTLDDATVDRVIEKILGSLERELQVTLRTE